MSSEPANLDELARELFPITRSVVGEGFDKSLAIVSRFIPFQVTEIPSETTVGDWTVPLAWNLGSGGGIFSSDGGKIVDFDESNIHVVSHSEPVDAVLSGVDLIDRINTLPGSPTLIPYVTSYYKSTWGVCMRHDDLSKISTNEKYRVLIPAKKFPGSLKLAETVIPGKLEDEILLSTYLCHPSMGNNELSGPLAMIRLWEKLSQRENLFSYRFLIAPETIGSIAWLSRVFPQVEHKIREAVVLTCLGGPEDSLSVKLSNSLPIKGKLSTMDSFLMKVGHEGSIRVRDFTPLNGSDERQFSAPGARISTTQFARTVYGTYPEYHTSGDDLEFMNVGQVSDSAETIANLLSRYEECVQPIHSNVRIGEPQLSKHGLYPTLSRPDQHYGDGRRKLSYEGATLDEILMFMHHAHDKNTLEITDATGLPLSRVESIRRLMSKKGIVEF